MSKIWKSSLPRPLKYRIFAATVQSVILYGCKAWTVSSKLAKSLDGCYTRMLRTAFNIHWKQHIPNKDLYGQIPKVSDKIMEKRDRFAGHCYRRTNEPVSKLVYWTPKHGKRKPGRPSLTYIDVLQTDTGLEGPEVMTAMQDRELWKAFVVRAHHST